MSIHYSKKIEKFYEKNESKIDFDDFMDLPDVVENIHYPSHRPDDLINSGFELAKNAGKKDVQTFCIGGYEVVFYIIGSEDEVLEKIKKLIK